MRGPFGSGTITVAEAAARDLAWCNEHRKTHRETDAAVKAHILPAFGDKQIAKLQTKQIRKQHRALATQAPRRRTAKGEVTDSAPSNRPKSRSRRAASRLTGR